MRSSDPRQILAAFVEDLIASGALLSEPVERAFRRVQRHRFVEHWYRLEASRLQAIWNRVEFDRADPDDESLAEIYSNRSLVTRVDGHLPTTSTSQPALVSQMLELLDIDPGMRVLEIGAGTGYNAALLAEIIGDAANVYTIDIQADVAEAAREALTREGYGEIHVTNADGVSGFPEGAPYDRIEATVGCSDLSPQWLTQLAPDGLMLIPLQHGHVHPLIRVTRAPESSRRARGEFVGRAAFMAIQGSMAWSNPWQSYLLGGLPREPVWRRELPISFPDIENGRHLLSDEEHLAFYFYLSLSSRELWRPNCGYGLADPGGRATAIITDNGIAAYHRSGEAACAERLCSRLNELLLSWDRLGRPAPQDYEIGFIPKGELPVLGNGSCEEWVVERIHFWEIVRLPSGSP